MRVLWHSNAPWATTGYGSQTALFTPLIQGAGHDVAISAFWGLGGKSLEWNGMRVYPSGGGWGGDVLPVYAIDHGKGDPRSPLVVTLMDVWVLENRPYLRELRVASWTPIDHDPVPPRVSQFFRDTDAIPIAMSRFGEDRLRNAGFDPLYVPHGVDTEILRPIPQSDVRAAMDIPEDLFIVGMVSANRGSMPSRKAFPQAFEAFARFHKDRPDSRLYLHTTTSPGNDGLDLMTLAEVCGVPATSVITTPQAALQLGIEYDKMAWIYSNMDVLMCPSYGEGFGIPIIEAQACGVPVLVNDFTSMPELVGAGWAIGGERFYDASNGSWWQAPSVADITAALHESYDARGELGGRSRAFAETYDVRSVMDEFMSPALEAADARATARFSMPRVSLSVKKARGRR